jgi:hypothetical protein
MLSKDGAFLRRSEGAIRFARGESGSFKPCIVPINGPLDLEDLE